MHRFLLLILLTIFSPLSFSEEPITIGFKQTLTSEVLSENRELMIYLPDSYNNSNLSPASYPVIYLLDAESNYEYFVGIVKKLNGGPYPTIPELIVVGIVNTDRVRDLTPTVDKKSLHDRYQLDDKKQQSGGNEQFFKFIAEELFPFIEKEYRTEDYRILVGHSYGGITTLNALLNYTEMFNAYIVHDPSMIWDDRTILKQYIAASGKDFRQRRLYLTQVDATQNGSSPTDFYKTIREFVALLESDPFEGLSYSYRQFPNETHGTLPMVGTVYGLQYLFEGFRVNIRAIADNPDLIESSYAAFSKKLGHTFTPSEAYIDLVGHYMLRIENYSEALRYYEQNLDRYPNSPQAHQSLADYYQKVGDAEMVEKHREKALALGYKTH